MYIYIKAVMMIFYSYPSSPSLCLENPGAASRQCGERERESKNPLLKVNYRCKSHYLKPHEAAIPEYQGWPRRLGQPSPGTAAPTANATRERAAGDRGWHRLHSTDLYKICPRSSKRSDHLNYSLIKGHKGLPLAVPMGGIQPIVLGSR